MTDLAQRYGAPRPVRRRVLIGVVAIVVLALTAWLVWAVFYQSTPKVTSGLEAFDVTDDHAVSVSYVVRRQHSDTAAVCSLQAVAEDHTVVGEQSIAISTGPTTQHHTVDVRTERRATSVTWEGCTAPGQKEQR